MMHSGPGSALHVRIWISEVDMNYTDPWLSCIKSQIQSLPVAPGLDPRDLTCRSNLLGIRRIHSGAIRSKDTEVDCCTEILHRAFGFRINRCNYPVPLDGGRMMYMGELP